MLTHHFRVCMLQLWSSLLVVGLFLPMLAVSEEAPIYQIDECATPMEITFHGLPSMPIKFEQTRTTCGKMENYVLQPTETQSYQLNDQLLNDQLPRITLNLHQGKLDVRVELRNDKLPRIYQAMQLRLDAKEHALQRVAHEGGPNLSVSVERIDSQAYIALNVNSTANQVARDIAKIKHLNIDHIERIKATPFRAHFFMMPVETGLNLLAEESQVIVRRNGKNSFIVGAIKDIKKIEALRKLADGYRERNETAKLKSTLEQMVELAKPNDAEDFEYFIPEVLQELTELAVAEEDYRRAEVFARARLVQIEHDTGMTDSVDYALALCSIGHIRAKQNDVAEAKTLCERALAIIEKRENANSSVSAEQINDLIYLALNAKQWDVASSLNSRILKILDKAVEPERKMLDYAYFVEGMVGGHWALREEYALAQPHLERALALAEKVYGSNHPRADGHRMTLARNAYNLNEIELAATLYARQIALSEQRIDRISSDYASALSGLAIIRAQQSNFAEAILLWQSVITLRTEVLGRNHPRVIAAINDLAFLYRLNGQLPEAIAATQRADAIQPGVAEISMSEKIDSSELKLDLAFDLGAYFIGQLKIQPQPPSNDLVVAVTLERLGEALYYGRHRDGTKFLATTILSGASDYEKAWQIRLKTQGVDHADTQRTAQRLIELYELGGDSSAAQRVRQHMKALPPLTPTLK